MALSRPPEKDSAPAGAPVTLRPAERVRRYLLGERARRGPGDGHRLPSVRQVARHVQVSTATVQSVFQKLAEEGQVRSEVGSGTFWTETEENHERVLQIGINVPEPQGNLPADWTYQIYGGILHGILQSKRPIVLRPLPPEALETEAGAAQFLDESRTHDGLILFPSRFSRRLRRLSETEGRPVVNLNPSCETATTNFVSPDYYGASRLLGIALREAGRRRVAVLVSPGLNESVSVRLRCAGVACGLGESLGREVEMRLFSVVNRDEEMGHRAVGRMLDEGFRPDCVYCAGDALALGALAALQEAGFGVPEEVSVVGGNGLGVQEAADRSLTVTRHPLDQLGAELVAMLLARFDTRGGDMAGVYLPPIFRLGSSTSSAENAILEELTDRRD